jgi:hypothetical protein
MADRKARGLQPKIFDKAHFLRYIAKIKEADAVRKVTTIMSSVENNLNVSEEDKESLERMAVIRKEEIRGRK